MRALLCRCLKDKEMFTAMKKQKLSSFRSKYYLSDLEFESHSLSLSLSLSLYFKLSVSEL